MAEGFYLNKHFFVNPFMPAKSVPLLVLRLQLLFRLLYPRAWHIRTHKAIVLLLGKRYRLLFWWWARACCEQEKGEKKRNILKMISKDFIGMSFVKIGTLEQQEEKADRHPLSLPAHQSSSGLTALTGSKETFTIRIL